MKLSELNICEDCLVEAVFVDDNDEILDEGALRQWKRSGQKMQTKYRCLAGPRKGKLVSKPGDCATRKDPKKVRQGRKTMRNKKAVISRKGLIAKKTAFSRNLVKMNRRLAGKTV